MGLVKIYYLCENNGIPFYVGKTKNTLRKRETSHIFRLKKYVKIQGIDEVEESEWKYWESYWIEQFKNWGFILENKNVGGGGLHNLSEEHIQKLRNKVCSESSKKKMSESRKGHPMYTDEWREKISKSKKGIPNPKLRETRTGQPHPKKSWEIDQYDIHFNYLKTYKSSKEAGEDLGKHPQNIRDAASGIQKTAYGFIWKYRNSKN